MSDAPATDAITAAATPDVAGQAAMAAGDTLTLRDALTEIALLTPTESAQALARYDELFISHPDAVRLLRARAKARDQLGDARGAAEDYARVLDAVPDDAPVLVSLARCQMKCGNVAEGKIIARQALDHTPNDRDAFNFVRMSGDDVDKRALGKLGAVRAKLDARQLPRAIADVRAFLAAEPDRADAQAVLADLLWRASKSIAAAQLSERILDDAPDCLVANVILHRFWLRAGSPTMAEAYLDTIDRLDPDRAEIKASLENFANEYDIRDVPARLPNRPAPDELDADLADDAAADTEAWVDELAAASALMRTRVGTLPSEDEGPVADYLPLDWAPVLGMAAAKSASDALSVTHDDIAPQPARVVEVEELPPAAATTAAAANRPDPEAPWLTPLTWFPADTPTAEPAAAVNAPKAAPAAAPAAEPPKKPKRKAAEALLAAEYASDHRDYPSALRQLEQVINSGKKPKETVAQLERLTKKMRPEENRAELAKAYQLLSIAYAQAEKPDAAVQALERASALLK